MDTFGVKCRNSDCILYPEEEEGGIISIHCLHHGEVALVIPRAANGRLPMHCWCGAKLQKDATGALSCPVGHGWWLAETAPAEAPEPRERGQYHYIGYVPGATKKGGGSKRSRQQSPQKQKQDARQRQEMKGANLRAAATEAKRPKKPKG